MLSIAVAQGVHELEPHGTSYSDKCFRWGSRRAPQGWFDFLAARCDDELETVQRSVGRLTCEPDGSIGAGDRSGRLDTAGTSRTGTPSRFVCRTPVGRELGQAGSPGRRGPRARAGRRARGGDDGRTGRQDPRLYARLAALDAERLDAAAARTLRLTLRDFRRAGVDLDEPQRRELQARRTLRQAVSSSKATSATIFRTVRCGANKLDGLPEDYVAAHRTGESTARSDQTTTYPDVLAVPAPSRRPGSSAS